MLLLDAIIAPTMRTVSVQVTTRTGGSLVEHRVVMREVVSSTPAGPTLRVLK